MEPFKGIVQHRVMKWSRKYHAQIANVYRWQLVGLLRAILYGKTLKSYKWMIINDTYTQHDSGVLNRMIVEQLNNICELSDSQFGLFLTSLIHSILDATLHVHCGQSFGYELCLLLQDMIYNCQQSQPTIQNTWWQSFVKWWSAIDKNERMDSHICAVDPGIKTFLTCVSTSGWEMTYGKNAIDMIKTCEVVETTIERMHLFTIKELLTSNGVIIVPKFSTKSRPGKPRSLRTMDALDHDSFLNSLKVEAATKNKCVIVGTEHMSTKVCFQCKAINEVGANDLYTCKHCVYSAGRDLNAARNILYMNVETHLVPYLIYNLK